MCQCNDHTCKYNNQLFINEGYVGTVVKVSKSGHTVTVVRTSWSLTDAASKVVKCCSLLSVWWLVFVIGRRCSSLCGMLLSARGPPVALRLWDVDCRWHVCVWNLSLSDYSVFICVPVLQSVSSVLWMCVRPSYITDICLSVCDSS